MSEWKPIRPGRGGIESVAPVRLSIAGEFDTCVLHFSRDVMEPWGSPAHVTPVLNGSPHMLGLRAAERAVRGETLKMTAMSAGSRHKGAVGGRISIKGTLQAMGKALRGIDSVPHSWDGDVLVLDLSGLPDATGGQ